MQMQMLGSVVDNNRKVCVCACLCVRVCVFVVYLPIHA